MKNYFAAYGGGATINGPILTRADVTAKLNIADGGAFNNLPANLPVFGRADVVLPTDAGGGFPQNNYQTINKVDISLNSSTQAYVMFALQRVDAFSGTQSASPYPQYQTGTSERKYNINSNVDARLVEQLHQPVEARLEQTVGRPAGERRGRAAAGDEPDGPGPNRR